MSVLTALLQVNLGLLVSLSFHLPLVAEQNVEDKSTDYLWARCPSCHPNNSIKALKETKPDTNQWSGPILSHPLLDF